MNKSTPKLFEYNHQFKSSIITGNQKLIMDPQSNVTFDPHTGTNNVEVLVNQLANIEVEMRALKANVEYFNTFATISLDNKRNIGVLQAWSQEKDDAGIRIKDYLIKTEKLHHATLSIIVLAPIALLFVIYYVLRDVIAMAPEWVNTVLLTLLGISAFVNFVSISRFVPGDINRLKEDIHNLKDSYKDINEKMNKIV